MEMLANSVWTSGLVHIVLPEYNCLIFGYSQADTFWFVALELEYDSFFLQNVK